MEKTLQAFRYTSNNYFRMILIGFTIILANVAATDLIYYWTDHSGTNHLVVSLTSPFELVSCIFALLTGLIFLITDYKVNLVNGISRKTYLLAIIPAAVILAAAFSLFNLSVEFIHSKFWLINLFSELYYPHAGWAGLFPLQFTLYFLMVVLGWFITLAYYRCNLWQKWAISLAPFILYYLLRLANVYSNGTFFKSLENIFQYCTKSAMSTAGLFLALAIVLLGSVYLLIRRAPLQD